MRVFILNKYHCEYINLNQNKAPMLWDYLLIEIIRKCNRKYAQVISIVISALQFSLKKKSVFYKRIDVTEWMNESINCLKICNLFYYYSYLIATTKNTNSIDYVYYRLRLSIFIAFRQNEVNVFMHFLHFTKKSLQAIETSTEERK